MRVIILFIEFARLEIMLVAGFLFWSDFLLELTVFLNGL